MFWYVLLGFLAAFGLLCALWVLLGLILPGAYPCEAAVLCPRGREIAVIRRFCRLRELGLTRSSLTVLDSGLTLRQQHYIRKRYPYIQFCARQAWQTGQGRVCAEHGTGNGDPAGHHRSGGIPEL